MFQTWQYTENENQNVSGATNGKLMLSTQFSVCINKKKKILKSQETKIFLRHVWNRMVKIIKKSSMILLNNEKYKWWNK